MLTVGEEAWDTSDDQVILKSYQVYLVMKDILNTELGHSMSPPYSLKVKILHGAWNLSGRLFILVEYMYLECSRPYILEKYEKEKIYTSQARTPI